MSWQDSDQEDTTIYKAVYNHEEQYSIWPVDRKNPPGWFDSGKSGTKAEVLAYIKEVWTDMRPLSLRKKMEEMQPHYEELRAQILAEEPSADNVSGDLVKRLSIGQHPVEATTRPKGSVDVFKEDIERGYVHIKFTDTRGGTELGFKLDREALRSVDLNFDQRSGKIHIEGNLSLDFVKVRCVAEIEIETLTGQGHLIPLTA